MSAPSRCGRSSASILAAHALQRAETLSGGQQQRVAIARALVQEPAIVLADEPVASLDPRNAARVMDALRVINREDGITVLCNLHALEVARAYCDRIVGMAAGRVVFNGTPDTLTPARVREICGTDDPDDTVEEDTDMLSRRELIAGLTAGAVAVTVRPRPAAAADWRERHPVLNFGVVSGSG